MLEAVAVEPAALAVTAELVAVLAELEKKVI
jgi:hypothetical protein